LWGRYYDNETFSGPAVAVAEQAWTSTGATARRSPAWGRSLLGELTGTIAPVHSSGTQPYTFWVSAGMGVQLWVDGQLLIDHPADQPYPGDANHDGLVDFNDMVKIAQHYNDSSQHWTWEDGDFTGDGIVDFEDYVKYNRMPTPPSNRSLPGRRPVVGDDQPTGRPTLRHQASVDRQHVVRVGAAALEDAADGGRGGPAGGAAGAAIVG